MFMVAKMMKRVSEFVASMPGLPVLIAIGLAVVGLVLQFLPSDWPITGWLARTDLLLYIAVIMGLLGILLGDAL
jgi:hypothetical protein